jgi:hypothetical protein
MEELGIKSHQADVVGILFGYRKNLSRQSSVVEGKR